MKRKREREREEKRQNKDSKIMNERDKKGNERKVKMG